ncbi:ATP-binding protein, partial [bacterium]|nr:ATP-binding protein [bacterium]
HLWHHFLMKDVFIEILTEGALEALPTVKYRSSGYEEIESTATAFIGVRRCGKTMLLKHRAEELLEQGISTSQILYINFFDERLSSIESSDLALLIEAFAHVYPDYDPASTLYIMLDEIQVVAGWEAYVSRLLRDSQKRIYLTGSSAHLLSREIATSMRGRALTYEVFPLSFSEYAAWSGIKDSGTVALGTTALERGQLSQTFDQYFEEGGFPAAFQLHPSTRQRLLEDYFRVAIYLDVIDRHKVGNPKPVEALCRMLIHQSSSLYTINKLTNKLRSQGYRVDKELITEVISWFEDAYLLESLPLFTDSEQRRRVNPKKIYCIDHALASALSFGFSQNRSSRLENIIYIHLRHQQAKFAYYKTQSGYEIDFCLVRDDLIHLIQVSESLYDENTKERECRALVEAAQELGTTHLTIVTYAEEEFIMRDGHEIRVVPAWKFCLGGKFDSTSE